MKKSQKVEFGSKKKFFFRTVNQLKSTSDCIKIDPPGPGRNLKKSQKKSKKVSKILDDFFGFFWVWFFLPTRFFIGKKEVFSAGGVAAGAFFCEKKVQNFGQNFGAFFCFFGGLAFLPNRFFISKKQFFSAGGVAAGAFFV